MKEQTESHSHPSSTDSHDEHLRQHSTLKNNKSNKTRPIHKEKGHQQQSEKQKIKLTKEERAKIQKQKNRQAAQRSRDMHKQYVSNLERELVNLKQELNLSRRYCYRCRQSLQNESSNIMMEQNINLSAQNQENSLQGSITTSNQSSQQFNEPDSFLRILEPHEENSLLKLMLFVCMIIIGVMVGFGNKQTTLEKPRGLMQVYSESTANTLKQDAMEINQVEKWTSDKGLVQLSQGIEDPVCLDSLMRVQPPMVRKSLRSIHQSTVPDEQQAIMLCSLRYPKSYEISPQITQTPLVKIFVLGSQIKELASKSPKWSQMRGNSIQLNGIYKLSAEIKNIELVSHHNCLL